MCGNKCVWLISEQNIEYYVNTPSGIVYYEIDIQSREVTDV